MAAIDAMLAEFFREYEARMGRALAGDLDVEATAAAFADCFIQADPNGIACGKNDEQLRAVIPQGIAFYRSIGTTSMAIRSVALSPLDEYHYTAKVEWRARYEKRDGTEETVDFAVVYLVRTIGGEPKIFGFITGDEQQLYREKGLIPG